MKPYDAGPSGADFSTNSHGRRVLVLAFGSTSCMVMGVTSIMPMIPAMAKIFGISQTTASLAITMFTLPGILFALFSGMLADRFGRKTVLVPSLFVFCVAGVACAFAGSFEMLLALRFIQGTGASSLGVLNATIIADTWSGPKMATIIGYNITVLNVCTAIYPSLGGALAHFDWRYPFFLPLFALPVLYVACGTPLPNPGEAGNFRHYLRELGRIFHDRRITGLLAITGLTFLLLYGPIITCFPVLADSRFGASPAIIGGAMIFSSVGAGVTASQLGRLYARFSSRSLLLASQVLYLVSMLFLVNFTDLAWMLFPILLFGIGQGMNIPNVQAQLLGAATPQRRAAVMSVNGMLLRLGQTLAPVSFSLIMAARGLNWGFYTGMALAVALAAMVILFVPKAKP